MSFVAETCKQEDRQATAPLIPGLVIAKVHKRLDDGTYELIYRSIGSDEHSAPARVVMPMAGGGRGVYFMPEPGDEVIVGFEQGEPNLPIVLGAVWNESAKPPEAARASESGNDVRTIVSRSGHQVTLDDSAGKEKVTVRTHGKHELTLDDSAGAAKISIQTAGGLSLVFDDVQKSLTISAPISITLRTGLLTLAASGGIALSANGLLTIDGTPFLAHIHTGGTIPPGVTGPVKP